MLCFSFQLPINFLKVELNNALPYPIQFEAKRLIDLMIARNFKVVSLKLTDINICKH